MVNVVSLFTTIVSRYNQDPQHCGRCWQFLKGPVDFSNVKNRKIGEQCCTTFILETFRQKEVYDTINDGHPSILLHEDITFTLFIGVDSDLTRQMYNEKVLNQDGIDNSKWKRYMEPLHDCLENMFGNNFCTTIAPANIRQIEFVETYNYKDQNYDGFMVNGIIRKQWQ